jgi:cephalosporin hydroxylase
MIPYESLFSGESNKTLRDSIQDGALRYTWRGIPCWKSPFDLAIYAQLLYRQRPSTIIEIGTAHGGSALWLRDQMHAMQLPGRVISVDHCTDYQSRPLGAPGVAFLKGDAHDLASTLDGIMPHIVRPLLVIEDSSHYAATTLAVLEYFDPWLRPGEICVVEDANVVELYPDRFPCGGPAAGIAEFRSSHENYVSVDEYCNHFGPNVTWNPDGYLRKMW